MFYGAVIKSGQEVVPTKADGGEILHLSQACLASGGNNETCYLMLENEGNKKFAVCGLDGKNHPQAQLDIFLNTNPSKVKLSVKGRGEIHVVGYFEPADEGMPEDGESESEEEEEEVVSKSRAGAVAEEEEEDEEQEEEEEKLTVAPPVKARYRQGKDLIVVKGKNEKTKPSVVTEKNKGAGAAVFDKMETAEGEDNEENESDSGDEQEEGSEAEIESGDDEEGLLDVSEQEEEEDESDEEEENPMFQQIAQKLQQSKQKAQKASAPKAPSKQQTAQPAKPQQHKRKQTEEKTDQRQNTKKVKGSGGCGGESGGGGGFDKFEKELESYLRTNGRTPLASLGSHVKRPTGVEKLGAFMRERPQKFHVENGFVSLAK
eukprot:GHVS01026496.1.p1 GENE.GHVS01026496.1~~GHVS01026496.1.p1  ORF type:complete len:375 (+),score=120.10 GHVS01026496.1:122-1246(+)